MGSDQYRVFWVVKVLPAEEIKWTVICRSFRGSLIVVSKVSTYPHDNFLEVPSRVSACYAVLQMGRVLFEELLQVLVEGSPFFRS